MSRFFLNFPLRRESAEVNFPAISTILKGTTIISLADSEQIFELGLSENLQLRIESIERHASYVSVYSTLGADEAAPARIRLIREGEDASVSLIERRLRDIRQLYALSVLLNNDRGEEAAINLREDPTFDLEELLPPEERLYIQAASPGSLWATLYTKVKGQGENILLGLSLLYDEGREHLLRRVRARTEAEEIKTEKARLELNRCRLDTLIETANKIEGIKNKELRRIVSDEFQKRLNSAAPEANNLLPHPSDDKDKN